MLIEHRGFCLWTEEAVPPGSSIGDIEQTFEKYYSIFKLSNEQKLMAGCWLLWQALKVTVTEKSKYAEEGKDLHKQLIQNEKKIEQLSLQCQALGITNSLLER